ncbi:Aberrant root formation protein 4 [Quillaja saponaria]|uniref:Aberrant root formation protein 4 n=1 Tax=Quillaja saponaria TaxID=32244 RepID=A0AAD7LXP7_QUISA|nr:Aberrant root formation protein 4 [Quillaja saponaria]
MSFSAEKKPTREKERIARGAATAASVESKEKGMEISEARHDVLRLREILNSCSKPIEGAGSQQSDSQVEELVNFLDLISDAALSDPDNEHTETNAFEVLSETYQYISSPSVDQAVGDALSFELPKAVSQFAGISQRCLDMATGMIDQLILMCGPRDMLSILCNALGSSSRITKASTYILPLLSGLSKVFLSLQRRHFEHIKVAVPIILNVLKAVPLELDEGELVDIFERAVGIANSIHAICTKLEGSANEKLRALFGLYILQCMALVSVSMSYRSSSCHSLMLQLSHFFPYCGLSYLNLLTTYDVDSVTSIVFEEDKENYMSLSYVKHGGALSVIWGQATEGIAQSAGEDLISVKDELRSNQTKRWQAIGTLKHVLSWGNLPWELRKQAVNFLLCITNGNNSQGHDAEDSDWSTYVPNLFASLQAVKMVIMSAPDRELRKHAFDALKRILADIPTSMRFDILKALITNTESSSMIAILIDLLKAEMHKEIRNRTRNAQMDGTFSPNILFWTPGVLELVELILRPPQGGPPSLPEHIDAVLSVLNLYRFIFITESTGETNHTGILSKNNLEEAYNQWLLPLRTLVTGIMPENKNDCDQLALDTLCTLNPIELVLYRCIELVEEKLTRTI